MAAFIISNKYSSVAVQCPTSENHDDYFCQAFSEGLILGSYRFLDFFTDERGEYHLEKITMVGKCCTDASKKGATVANAVCKARNLANNPPNVSTPSRLAEFAQEVGKKGDMKVTVFDREEFTKMGMGAFAGVAQGTNEPPKFIIMEYFGAESKDEKPVVLVGKGLTFDTGGISLKPGAKMDEMKFDMCGSAIVFGTMNAVAELRPKKNIVAIVPSTHNMLGGSAFLPGDILTAYNGKTIEILNTDAEGRLILADALTYTQRFKPKLIIDMATLTGACVVALGAHHSGLMSNSDQLADQLFQCGQSTDDVTWRLPLTEEYANQIVSNFADVANISTRGSGAGTITAGCFLQKFVGEYDWAHIDIAGVAWAEGANKGATGRPMGLMSEFLINESKT